MMKKLHVRSAVVATGVAVALSLTGCGFEINTTQPDEGQQQQEQQQDGGQQQQNNQEQPADDNQGNDGQAPDSSQPDPNQDPNQGTEGSSAPNGGQNSTPDKGKGGSDFNEQETTNKASDTRIKLNKEGTGTIPAEAIEADILDLMKNKYDMNVTSVKCYDDVRVYQGRGSASCELKTPDGPYYGTVIVKEIKGDMIKYEIKFPNLAKGIDLNK